MIGDGTNQGIWLIDEDGGVFTLGNAVSHGSMAQLGETPVGGIIAAAVMSNGLGYWMLDAAGNVYPFGEAPNLGSWPDPRPPGPRRWHHPYPRQQRVLAH